MSTKRDRGLRWGLTTAALLRLVKIIRTSQSKHNVGSQTNAAVCKIACARRLPFLLYCVIADPPQSLPTHPAPSSSPESQPPPSLHTSLGFSQGMLTYHRSRRSADATSWPESNLIVPLTHSSQTRRDHHPESRQRQLHSREATSQPPRLPPPLHLPPSDYLVWLWPQSHHRLSAQWGLLRLRRLIPHLAALWLASR